MLKRKKYVLNTNVCFIYIYNLYKKLCFIIFNIIFNEVCHCNIYQI